MATRYSGDLTIKVSYDDRNFYRAKLLEGAKTLWRGTVGPPASGYGNGIAYDSAKAYDQTAHAALSFADDEKSGIGDLAEYTDSGWRIRRSPPPHRHRYKAPWSRDSRPAGSRRRTSIRTPKRRARRKR